MGTVPVNGSQNSFFYVNNFPPQIENLYDELDSRDSNNQPIKTSAAINSLNEIFKCGLFNLLICSEAYSISEALRTIRNKLNLASQSLSKKIADAFPKLQEAILPLYKKFVKVLILLSGLFAFNVLVSLLSFQLQCLTLALIRINPPVFRC